MKSSYSTSCPTFMIRIMQKSRLFVILCMFRQLTPWVYKYRIMTKTQYELL